jgi:hypothetical protein
MMAYKEELKEVGLSLQLVVYILFFEMLNKIVKKYKRVLVRRVGGVIINALITYTYCCVIVAIVLGNDIIWERLIKAF